MVFLKDSKRKISVATAIVDEDIFSININEKFITDGHSTANFERLLYIGCPVLPMEGRRIYQNKDQPSIVDANRKLTTIKICNAIHSMDKTDRTKINIFRETVSFIRMMDSEGIDNIFSFDAVSRYINGLVKLYKKGVKGKTLSSRQLARTPLKH